MQCFSKAEIKYIPRELNSKADSLSKLASQQWQIQHNSVIQQTLNNPTVGLEECFNVTTTKDDWIKAYVEVIKNQEHGIEVDSKITKKTTSFVLIGDELYKRGYSTPFLKCLSQEQAEYMTKELHEGIYGLHCGARTMATKICWAGYYWPSIREECNQYVKACKKCQEFVMEEAQGQAQMEAQQREDPGQPLESWPRRIKKIGILLLMAGKPSCTSLKCHNSSVE